MVLVFRGVVVFFSLVRGSYSKVVSFFVGVFEAWESWFRVFDKVIFSLVLRGGVEFLIR